MKKTTLTIYLVIFAVFVLMFFCSVVTILSQSKHYESLVQELDFCSEQLFYFQKATAECELTKVGPQEPPPIPLTIETKEQIESFPCDVCGRNMRDSEGTAWIGTSFLFESKNLYEVYPELEQGKQYSICSVCFLKALGITFGRGQRDVLIEIN